MTWTTTELDAVRADLTASAERLERQVSARAIGDVELGPHDELDAATTHIESSQSSAELENAVLLLEQTRHVLTRLDAGLYGSCESCGGPIGRERMEAFPRAVACMACLGSGARRAIA